MSDFEERLAAVKSTVDDMKGTPDDFRILTTVVVPQLLADLRHWKSNHDEMVEQKKALTYRLDLKPEEIPYGRVKLIDEYVVLKGLHAQCAGEIQRAVISTEERLKKQTEYLLGEASKKVTRVISAANDLNHQVTELLLRIVGARAGIGGTKITAEETAGIEKASDTYEKERDEYRVRIVGDLFTAL